MKELGFDTSENTRIMVRGYSFIVLLIFGWDVAELITLVPNTFFFWLFMAFWTWFVAYLGSVWFSGHVKEIIRKFPSL